jgi:hypothetical protein
MVILLAFHCFEFEGSGCDFAALKAKFTAEIAAKQNSPPQTQRSFGAVQRERLERVSNAIYFHDQAQRPRGTTSLNTRPLPYIMGTSRAMDAWIYGYDKGPPPLNAYLAERAFGR